MSNEGIVHVIDDDIAVRRSLSFLLASDGLPVRLYETAQAFLDQTQDEEDGCIVTDLRMPGVDGIEFLRRLKARGSSLPVIVITARADVSVAVEALRQGAVDFIEKPFADDTFLVAVRNALCQQAQVTHRRSLVTEVRAHLCNLSQREREVLDGLLVGKPNKVIAFDLDISPRTVEVHRASLMTKLRAESLSELVRLVLMASAEDND